jgi:hypothetical protein
MVSCLKPELADKLKAKMEQARMTTAKFRGFA